MFYKMERAAVLVVLMLITSAVSEDFYHEEPDLCVLYNQSVSETCYMPHLDEDGDGGCLLVSVSDTAVGQGNVKRRDRGLLSGHACQPWEFFSIGSDSDYDSFNDTHCRYVRKLDQEGFEKSFGPWCFTVYNYVGGKSLAEPCFNLCDNVLRDESPRAQHCFWKHELPLKEFQDYAGRDFEIYYLGLKKFDCMKWSEVYEKLNPKYEQVKEQYPDWQLHEYRGEASSCRVFEQPPSEIAGPLTLEWFSKNVRYDKGVPPLRYNQDLYNRPWCFVQPNTTSNYVAWAYCHDLCEDIATCVPRDHAATFDYLGTQATSLSGHPCQNWTTTDLYHPFTRDNNSFCRSRPSVPVGPFCIVGNSVFAEQCFPHCQDAADKNNQELCVGDDKLIGYFGTRNITLSGLHCQRWDLQSPNRHRFGTPKAFDVPEMWMVSNFCRNPDASLEGPWCYTLNESIRERESCFRPCEEHEEAMKQQSGNVHAWLGNLKKANFGDGKTGEVLEVKLSAEDILYVLRWLGFIIAPGFIVFVVFYGKWLIKLFRDKFCFSTKNKLKKARKHLISVIPGIFIDQDRNVQIYHASDGEYEWFSQLAEAYKHLKDLSAYGEKEEEAVKGDTKLIMDYLLRQPVERAKRR